MLKKSLLGLGLATILLPLAATAQPGDSQLVVTGVNRAELRSVVVSLSDLDLRQDQAVRAADNRLRYAADEVCNAGTASDLYQKRQYDACYLPAVSAARNDLSAIVTARRS